MACYFLSQQTSNDTNILLMLAIWFSTKYIHITGLRQWSVFEAFDYHGLVSSYIVIVVVHKAFIDVY